MTRAVSEPWMPLLTVSVAVIDCDPAVLSVTGNVPTPSVRVALGGRMAWPSELVMWTVPA